MREKIELYNCLVPVSYIVVSPITNPKSRIFMNAWQGGLAEKMGTYSLNKSFVFRPSDNTSEELQLQDSSSSDQDSPIDLDKLLQVPDSQQREEEAEVDQFFKDTKKTIKVGSLWEQEEEAKDQAVKEKIRRSDAEYHSRKEENEKMRRKLEEKLTNETILNQEWSTIISQACSSTRHNIFHHGSARERQGLQGSNFSHILSQYQNLRIIEQLNRWGSYEDQAYVELVLLPQAITILYADNHNITPEEANQRLLATGFNDNEGTTAESDGLTRSAAG